MVGIWMSCGDCILGFIEFKFKSLRELKLYVVFESDIGYFQLNYSVCMFYE